MDDQIQNQEFSEDHRWFFRNSRSTFQLIKLRLIFGDLLEDIPVEFDLAPW